MRLYGIAVLLPLLGIGRACISGGGGDSGGYPVDPYRPYITELEDEVNKTNTQLDDGCPTCEAESRRRILRSLRCGNVLCDFENSNICKWKTSGSPGAPIPFIEKFLEENPEFAEYYARAKLHAEQNRVLRRQFLHQARLRRLRKHSHRRTKRQSIADTLAGLQDLLAAQNSPDTPPVDAAEQAARDVLGAAFGEPGAEAAAQAVADLENENKIPINYEKLLEKIEADKSWGVYGGPFARHVTGLREAAQGEKYAVTYVYPAEWSIMSVSCDLSDDDYYLRFSAFEHNDDVRFFVACDSIDRPTVTTPISGTNDGTRQWQTFTAMCPQGTKRFLLVCENVSETKEGACAVDDMQLYTKRGVNYCQGVEPVNYGPNAQQSQPAPNPTPGPLFTVGPFPLERHPPVDLDPEGLIPDLTDLKNAIGRKIAGAATRLGASTALGSVDWTGANNPRRRRRSTRRNAWRNL